MSRIGKNPVTIPSTVTVEMNKQTLTVKGAKGELTQEVPTGIEVKIEDNTIVVDRKNNSKPLRALHGTIRALAANMIVGVSDGYTKRLMIEGVGFKAVLQGRVLVLSLGYSHEIHFKIPDGVEITLEGNGTEVIITGYDKQKVGQAAAQIRSYYKAEPYKGKGVRYKDETIRRKAGKAVA
ncbi:MAG: 50S ribosomal protein L6 [Kiritimatiellae bacterium]|jgi:large subunit ribosomal protein L6|nr:50S ribosomal protein L6 [Kiritimatiellia bacterium]